MTETKINVEDLNASTKIVHMEGQLDESNIDEKIKEVYAGIDKVPKGLQLIFDLSALDYMNSKSIGYLTDIYGKVTEGGGRVVIAGAKPNIADILQVVGLTQIIETVGTLEEAKAKLASAPTAPAAATPAPAPAAPATPAPAPAPAPEPQPIPPSPAPTVQAPQPEAPKEPAPSPVVPPVSPPAPAVSPAPAAAPVEAPAPAPALPADDEGTYKFEQQ